MRDGMDIINFSGGGPQADPRTDVLIEAVGTSSAPASSRSSRPGTTATSSGSGRRDRRRRRRTRSASVPSRTRTSSARRVQVVAPGGLLARCRSSRPTPCRPSWISTNQRLVDVGSIAGGSQAARASARPRLVARRDRARQPRGVSVQREGVTSRGRQARRASSSPRTDPATRRSRSSPRSPAGRSPTSTARGSARPRPARAAPCTVRFTRDIARGADDLGRRPDELHLVGADAVRPRAQAGRHRARGADPLVDASRVRGRPVSPFSTGRASPRRTSRASRRSSRSAIRRGRRSR